MACQPHGQFKAPLGKGPEREFNGDNGRHARITKTDAEKVLQMPVCVVLGFLVEFRSETFKKFTSRGKL